jgi:hypothetical protein
MRQITNCSMCKELLGEEEGKYFDVTVDEMPLCLECLLKDW